MGRTKTKTRKKQVDDWDNTRVMIRNFVARSLGPEQECCICGKPAKILHNKHDPYYIAFICDECRKDVQKLSLAEERRFDVRTKVKTKGLNTRHFTDQMVIRYIIGFMNDNKTIGDYCEEVQISRYQFTQLQNRYDKMFPKQNIKKLIKDKSNRLRQTKNG